MTFALAPPRWTKLVPSAVQSGRPRGPYARPFLGNTFAFDVLARKKKRFDQFAFAANGHSRKPLVPLALGDIGFRVEPLGQQLQLRRRDLPALDPVEQVLEESGRDVLTANLRHNAC